MALVLLGLTLSAERTVISPVSVEPVHHFWEMLGYLANTVLFVLVGIVISETAIPNLGREDFPYLFLLYVTLHVMRLGMLLLFFPILNRLGYGLSWESMIVMMWGGLRGAVGVCLALQVYQDVYLCDKANIGPKILFHTAGIVFLTLVINGTTTKGLLQTLKLTEVTAGQKEQMNAAVRRISHTQWKLTRGYQSYKYMMDASWEMVNSVCTVANPYIVESEETKKIGGVMTLNPPRPVKDNTTVCWQCNNIVLNEPTISEYREMSNDARIGVIKAMKVHYSHQFEEGTLTEQAVQVLLTDAEYAEDIYLSIIQSHNFHKHMKVHGFYPWLRDKVIVRFGLHKEEHLPEPPSCK
ncbi:unnamed protein product [Orchesella dallaii]|uniref:Cation/H+ exchanger domain-containing protein n=1 Tax=Orchesella dallaii TaxID=48710 RepID=A0ABP1RNT5_9HEXA